MFDIRYSFRKQGTLIILELPAAEALAEHLRDPVILRGSAFHRNRRPRIENASRLPDNNYLTGEMDFG
jgi:hypothetical protein